MISRRAGNVFVVAALAVIVGGSAAAAEGRRGLERGDLLPEDGLCLVRVKSITELVNGVSAFVDAIQPGISAMLKAQMGTKLFVAPAEVGLDADRPAGAVILNPKKFEKPWILIAPVAEDTAALLAELENLLGQRQELDKKVMKYGDDMFVRIANGHVVFGASEDAVNDISGALGQKGLGTTGADTARLTFDAGQFLKLYREEIKAIVDDLRKDLAEGGGADMMGGGPLAMIPAFATLGKLFSQLGPDCAALGLDLLEQVEGLETALTINGEKLAVATTLVAKAGSSLEKVIDAQKPLGASVAEFVPEGGIVCAVARCNEEAMRPHVTLAGAKLRATLEGIEAGDDQMKAFRKELVDLLKLMDEAIVGGDSQMAVAMVQSGGGVATLTVALRPEMTAAKITALAERGVNLISDSTILKEMMAMGGGQLVVKLEKEARESAGLKINRLAQQNPGAPANVMALTQKMYGVPQVTEFAFDDAMKAYIAAGGKDSAKRMDELIARVKGGKGEGSFGASEVYAVIQRKAPKTAVVLWAVSPSRYGKMVLDMMSGAMNMNLPPEATKGLDDMAATEQPIWGYVDSGRGAATLAYEIPAPTLGKLFRFFQQQMMLMMQGGGGMGPGQPLPPPPPDGGIGGGVF